MMRAGFIRKLLWILVFEITFLNGGCFSEGYKASRCRPVVIASCEP